LAQLPLRWVLAKASSHGLTFKRNVELDPEASTAPIEDSFSDFLGGAYRIYKLGQRNWRPIGREPEKRSHTTVHIINETIDKSVFDRWHRDPTYRPNNLVDWINRRHADVANLTTSVTTDDPSIGALD
jgi:hypothetical protein